MIPLMTRSVPTAAKPRIAKVCACRETQALARSIARGVQSGATTKHTNGTSISQSMTRLKPITSNTVGGCGVVELVDRMESGEVRGAGERQQRADDERDACGSLVELALPPRRSFVGLGGLALLSALPQSRYPPGVEHERDDQCDRAQRDVDRRTDRVLGRVGRARIAEREDDDDAERDARHERADQIAAHQLRRPIEQQHHGHRGDERRVQRRRQRQQNDVAHAVGAVATAAGSGGADCWAGADADSPKLDITSVTM